MVSRFFILNLVVSLINITYDSRLWMKMKEDQWKTHTGYKKRILDAAAGVNICIRDRVVWGEQYQEVTGS